MVFPFTPDKMLQQQKEKEKEKKIIFEMNYNYMTSSVLKDLSDVNLKVIY